MKKWFSPTSLRFQLLARSLLILAVLLLIIGGSQYVLMKNFLYQNEAESMFSGSRGLPKDGFELLGLSSDPTGKDGGHPSNPASERYRGAMLFFEQTSVAIVGASNHPFIDLSGTNKGALSPQLTSDEYKNVFARPFHLNEKAHYVLSKDATGSEQILVFRPLGSPDSKRGMMQIGKPTAPLKAIVMQQLYIFIALSAVALIGGLALYIPILRRTLNPLQNMVEAVERTDAGNLDERFPHGQGQEEMDRLALSFNRMLGRLESSFISEREAKEQMRQFIADASHELRTPLTSIHGFLEVLLRGAASNKDQLHIALNSMHGESVRMKKLVEDLLMLAKLDRAPDLQRKHTDLGDLVEEMQPHLRMLADARTLFFKLEEDVVGYYDPDRIKQVILNVFHNAVQHTEPEQGIITVALLKNDSSALLSIQDNGPGIAQEHLPHLFDRFYRSESSRTRTHKGGAGLGLSISKAIAEAHHGDLKVKSKQDGGSTFTLELPL
ncbi:HAMP domain-containing histidine kinase [Paenibacillus sp. N1-5-1-14]|uniref:sensor histidine kinase n=1 Tax=Paenibacillus radicibacter TaxID=2972488 RepID=UPI0021594FF4|nr:HAMP domain-containing sensor histidine kinase [Paenibacillus radicibacter]MCR8643247.1 HAMP domain-containing histidine kinase [Paenibacillus radicibacter]